MVDAPLPTTRVTFLARLRQDPTDQAAWDAFVERYGRHIYRWCRQWKLQDADAEDVTQEILAKLAQKPRDLHYGPARSLPGLLKAGTPPRLREFLDGPRRRAAAGDSRAWGLNATLEARESLRPKPEGAFDHEPLGPAKVRVRL